MGFFFYLVPFHQPISAHAISSHNCHQNVSLPFGALPWMAFLAGSKGQNITYTHIVIFSHFSSNLSGIENACDVLVFNLSEYIVTLHKYLSQNESFFYAHVTSGAVWHLTLRKISPNQYSNFGHMLLANNVGVNFGPDSSPTLARGLPIHFHISHQALRFHTPSQNGKHGLLG